MSLPSNFRFLSHQDFDSHLTLGNYTAQLTLRLQNLAVEARLACNQPAFFAALNAASLASNNSISYNTTLRAGVGATLAFDDAAALTNWQTTLGITGINSSLAGKANKAGDNFTGPVVLDAGALLQLFDGFQHFHSTVHLQYPTQWRHSVDAAVAPNVVSVTSPTVLVTGNTMTRYVLEVDFNSTSNIRLDDLDRLKLGDTWEICQIGAAEGYMQGTTSVGGQVVTLQFSPGGGPRTNGQFSTMFVRIRAKAGTGAAATATVLVTGGVP